MDLFFSFKDAGSEPGMTYYAQVVSAHYSQTLTGYKLKIFTASSQKKAHPAGCASKGMEYLTRFTSPG
jgi:hypothetical protein